MANHEISQKAPLWLDCDPGHDDAFAILLAVHHPALQILGISTVHGNVSLEKTTANACSILTAFGRSDVPVYPGVARPFCRNAVHAPHIHGSTGIDGTNLLPTAMSPPKNDVNAIEAMRRALLSQPKGKAWLVATGALTNIALLFAVFPELVGHIKGLSIMGGAIGNGFSDAPMGRVDGEGPRIGNISAWAEFNIYCDPEAAQAVFANPSLAAKTFLIPLDLTHQVQATKEVLQRLVQGPGSSERALGPQNIDLTAEARNLRPMLHDLLTFFASTCALVYGLTSGPPLHDPIAVTIVLSEEASKDLDFDDRGERWHVNVVTDGLHSDSSEKRGQVGRIMLRQAAKNEGGVRIPRTLNVKRFWEIIDECIQYAEKALKH